MELGTSRLRENHRWEPPLASGLSGQHQRTLISYCVEQNPIKVPFIELQGMPLARGNSQVSCGLESQPHSYINTQGIFFSFKGRMPGQRHVRHRQVDTDSRIYGIADVAGGDAPTPHAVIGRPRGYLAPPRQTGTEAVTSAGDPPPDRWRLSFGAHGACTPLVYSSCQHQPITPTQRRETI